jgi:putative DNA primase/helicase
VFDIASGQLIPHRAEYLLTHQVPYEYDPNADCPTFKQFLREVLINKDGSHSEEWGLALQEWFGLALVPSSAIQAAHFWVGEGGNGKGVATRALQNLVGPEYCVEIPVEQLHDPYHRADLFGKYLGLVNEPDRRSMQKNGNWFKKITGGDMISARRPTEKVFSFTFTGRIILSCNDLPSTNDLSAGYFRRIVLIEWRYNVPKDKRDPELDEKLRLEMPGIFNWAIEGLRRVRMRGNRLSTPEESELLLAEYRKNEDAFGRFFEDNYERDPFGQTSINGLYAAYKKWSLDCNEYALSSHKVVARLEKMGFSRVVTKAKVPGENTWKSIKAWRGFSAVAEQETLPLEE